MKTILVVDDDSGLVEVLAATLSDLGYSAQTTTNGAQGLAVMAEHPPDLVLLDFMMPLLDGPGVLECMRSDPRLVGVPVLLMSALPESTVRARCSGPLVFLRKPFAIDALLDAVQRALGAVA